MQRILAIFLLLSLAATAEQAKVIESIERRGNHTTIIYKDYRKKPRPKVVHETPAPVPTAEEVDFRVYDLEEPRPEPQSTRLAPVQTYSQSYSPGPNRGMAANGAGYSSGFANYGYGFGFPYYPYSYRYPAGPYRVVVPRAYQNLPVQRFTPNPIALPYRAPVIQVRFPGGRCR
ncbi:MAG: hypothetical protein AB7S38_38915 [Vulcanimicrobiota bacterium]